MESSNWQERTIQLIGNEGVGKLSQSHVLVCGLGGVGSYAVEQLARAGVGSLTIIDGDTIHASNRNRQLPALMSTNDDFKAVVVADRIMDINPEIKLTIIQEYIKDQRIVDILQHPYDYVVDAIDTLAPKVYLIYNTVKAGIPLVSSMGSGGKLDPSQIRVSDINDTYNCKLAYYMRKRLHKLGIWNGFKAVYSPEVVSRKAVAPLEGELNKKSTVGTISYMPAMFGCYCASVVISDLLNL
jgi:tRNA A37 threonylcarbamoyladenosine dehydratase